MTGREKIEAAFSPSGTPEFPAVIPYETVLSRDHWKALTEAPWWNQFSPGIEIQMAWRRDMIGRLGQDWMRLPFVPPRAEREYLGIEVRPDGVFRVDRRSGAAELLTEPPVGGEAQPGVENVHHTVPAETPDEIERLVPLPDDDGSILAEGEDDLAARILEEFGDSIFPYCRVPSPLWCCYDLWGFEELMVLIAVNPELVAYAARRWLAVCLRDVRRAAALGARAIWIEECLTDMISPTAYESLNIPPLRELIREIGARGMRSIHYYCGNPARRLEMLLDTGADALALEEGKKGFEIDISQIAETVRGRCTLFGNLDAVGVLQEGTEVELSREIGRQLEAGRRNGGQFVMSLGSPVTPSTPIARVRRYCDLVREMGSR